MITNNLGINKLRNAKNKLRRLNKILMIYVDSKSDELLDSDTLKQMLLISQIDELITDVIYYIIDNYK